MLVMYSIRPGDSLSRIAGFHGISLKLLLALNPQIDNPNLIHPGQVILVPEHSTSPAAKRAEESNPADEPV